MLRDRAPPVGAYKDQTMLRSFWAFLAFNIYSIVLVSAFQQNTPYLFDAKLVADLQAAGEIFDLHSWGWKGHYLWRMCSALIVTPMTAFLAGAIARKNGGRIAAIANVPSVLIWIFTFGLMAFGSAEWEGQTGFAIVAIIAMPLTTWIAYHAGNAGAETQTSEFSEESVLGIRPYHWIWIVVPLYLYSLGIVFVIAKFLALQFMTMRDFSLIGSLISLLAFAPVFVWLAPPTSSYNILAGNTLVGKPPAVKALAVSVIVIGGIPIAAGIQFVCFSLLQRLMAWWYS